MPDNELMPSILDREIQNVGEDAFGHADFADALRSLIEAPDNAPPFSIGLLGSWGTGKSTIKSLYLRGLADDTSKSRGGKKRSERIKALTFNAWRYGGSADGNMKRALLRHVYLELGGSQESLKDELFHQLNKEIVEAQDVWPRVVSFCKRLLVHLVPTILFLALLLIAFGVAVEKFGIQGDWAKVAFTLGGSFVVTWLGIVFKPSALSSSSHTRIELPRTSAEEYEDLLVAQVEEFKGRNAGCERIVIFIDDLDRLSAQEMVDGLDAIRTFMEIPVNVLPDGLGMVFVISCDENRIAEALDKGRQRNSDMPGAVLNQDDARRYLDRIFQFRLEIPPFPKQDMRQFALKRLENSTEKIVKEVESNRCTIGTVVDRLIHVDVDSPRNALQLVNSFVQSWWLAKKREFAGAGTERPGGLSEGTVTLHPVTMAIVCALKVNYPLFYRNLLREPDLIQHFTDCFVQTKTRFEDLPPRAQRLLAEFHEDGSDTHFAVKRNYEALRRFIGSLRGHRWPDSLLPFLLLTQDAVSRKFSGRASHIHDALVSADVDGYLRELDRANDSKPISLDDAKLTADIIEDLEGETEVRRNNAVYVIAKTSARIPEEVQSRLLPPLCRQLELSREFRSEVGVDKVAEVLPRVHPGYQKDIARLLVEDACGEDGFCLSLATGQPPSLGEACEILEKVVELALSVWEREGLHDETEDVLGEWMLKRDVRLSETESTAFPFEKIDEWVRSHKDLLLPQLRENYTDQLIGELGNNRLESMGEESRTLCKEVFEDLQESGEEDRPVMWDQLSRMVAVQMESAVVFAWTFAVKYSPNANEESVAQFLQALSRRLHRDMTEDQWGIENWEKGVDILLEISNSRSEALSETTCKALAELARAYVTTEVTSEYSTQLLDVLVCQRSAESKPVLAEMVSHLLDELPEPGVKWLATHYATKLEDAERDSINAKLEALVSNVPQVTQESAAAYGLFLGSLQPAGWKSGKIQSHVKQAFALAQQNHGSFDPYVKLLFPALLKALPFVKEASIGHNLTALFQNVHSQPQALAWLHSQIKNQWPETYPGLNVVQIADTSLTASTTHPRTEQMGEVLLSLWTLEEKGLLPQDAYKQRLVELACTLWPHHQVPSSRVLGATHLSPGAGAVASLASSVDPNNGDALSTLRDTWNHMGRILTDADIEEVTKQVLASGAKGTKQDPDLILQAWLESLPTQRATQHVEAILCEEGLQDEHIERLWRLVVRQGGKYGLDFFSRAIPELFQRNDLDRTHRAMIESRGALDGMFGSRSERSTLSDALLLALVKAPSLERKRALGDWLSGIGGASKVTGLSKFDGELDEATLTVLSEVFPAKRRAIDKLKSALTSKSAERRHRSSPGGER